MGRLITGSLLLLVFGASVAPGFQDNQERDARYFAQQASKAYQKKDYPQLIDNMKAALALRPAHQTYMYWLAVGYALVGDKEKALSILSNAVTMGLVYPADKDPNLSSLRESDEFKKILSRIEKNRLPSGNATEAFTFPEKDLIPEGLAYDPINAEFFLSSIHKHKIVSISLRNRDAKDFSAPADGLWSVTGMRVDSKRRVLWVCTAAQPQMSDYRPEDNGKSGIFKYDLRNGTLLKKYLLANKPQAHWLGDLVLNSAGDVYASDSISPAIYLIDHKTDELRLFLNTPASLNPQGLAFTPDEKHLLMADYLLGLFLIDMRMKEYVKLPAPEQTTLLGIDGLYADGKALIGVQNGITPNRIVRVNLSKDATRVVGLELLEANNPAFNEPTLGVMLKDEFYFIANSQWGAMDEAGHIAAPEKLKEPVILKLPLTPGQNETKAQATNTPVYSENPEANDLFLKARQYLAQSDPRVAGGKLANAREAIKLYEQAVQKDPKFALAFVEMSRAWLRLGYSDPDGLSNKIIVPHARAALLNALALDKNLTDAHLVLASLYYNVEYAWGKAESEYKAVLQQAPNNAGAHTSYAGLLSSTGRFDEALAQAKKSEELAPSLATDIIFARIYYSMHRYDEAAEYCKRSLKKSENVLGHFFLGFIYVAQQRYEEAIAEFKIGTSFSKNGGALAGLAYGYAMAGKKDEALKILDELKTSTAGGLIVPYRVAAVYLALGDKDQAIQWLTKEYEDKGNWMNQLKVDPVMDPLRSDPRFQALMRKMKFR